ncbi:RNA polymerase sigma factor [Sphingobacterium tabacisoli]|uniref:RNA polymerase sigma factor n=1 Tax=Sphingobacterium tabacisoli TaxID=2044855 RepID=A0ABW5L1P8_9SPHI|nr:sigma-70 family RNA polymerase sigma factor [Sphingobacterium tabacisoli]
MSIHSDIDEKELLLRLRSSDKKAFEQLYGLYKVRLTGNLRRMLKSAELVEDVIHDIFLGIWANRRNIDPDQSLKPYIFTSAANRAKNIFRKAAHEQQFRDYLLPRWEENYKHVEEALFSKENKNLLDELLNHLSPQQRIVYTMCRLEGKSYKEVAQALDISEATVNAHISNANKFLKQLVQNNPQYLGLAFAALLLFSI